MKNIEDQVILLLYGFSALLTASADTVFLAGFLCTIIYVTINDCSQHKSCHIVSAALYLAAFALYPQLLCFSPVFLYSLLLYGNYSGIVLLFLFCLYQCHLGEFSLVLCQLPGYAAALLLHQRTSAYMLLEKQYRKTRDDGRELTLLLGEKNRALLKNQNNEIYLATLKERNRIAREIHDHVGHMLSCSILITGALKTINTDPAVGEPLRQLEDTLNTAMDNIRQSVHNLHDESVDLKSTLDHLVFSHTFCPVSLEYQIDSPIPADVKYCFIAIVKECLHNIAKHSSANHAKIILREHPGLYQLCVKDNGVPQEQISQSGLGLHNMQERIHSLHGTMRLYREHGFEIFITIPKGSSHEYCNH